MTSCAFTGHRHIPLTDDASLRELLLRGIRFLYEQGVRTFYAGGALGFDMMAEEAVLDLRRELPGIRLCLIFPHRGQCERWPTAEIRRYRAISEAADSVEYVSDFYYEGVMEERNRALVDRADVCIAYLTHGGGAAQTVSFAKKKGIPVYNLAKGLQETR